MFFVVVLFIFINIICGKIEYYSVAYFNYVTEFEALLSISVEFPLGGAHINCIDVSGIYASMQYV